MENHTTDEKARNFKIRIDEKIYTVTGPIITGGQILKLVDGNPESLLVSMVIEGQPDVFIDIDEKVDLTQPGREHFTTIAKDFYITIDEEKFIPNQRSMTGQELRLLPQPAIGDDRDLWLDILGKDDDLIEKSERVTLKNGMAFYTAPSTINPGA